METPPAPSVGTERRRGLRTLAEGKRFEAYVEQQTPDMRVCAFCDRVFYRKKPIKAVGKRWVCIDCLKSLKESLDTLDRWEEMSVLHEEIERDVHGGLKR
ncbi:MAG TPA: hypothetical protein VGV89_00295 [Thermoplasmata archaeon]|nr:hypothetical protein [Thermoplasmata archaeon]